MWIYKAFGLREVSWVLIRVAASIKLKLIMNSINNVAKKKVHL